jgi:hypothetical protein
MGINTDINYGNEQEVIQMLTSEYFMRALQARIQKLFKAEALRFLGFSDDRQTLKGYTYGEFTEFFRVARGRFRTPQICIRNILKPEDVEDCLDGLALGAVTGLHPILEAIQKAGGIPALTYGEPGIGVRIYPWNEYDPLCNPELLKPYWKMVITVTWQHPDDLGPGLILSTSPDPVPALSENQA